jgi:hypothetical protein
MVSFLIGLMSRSMPLPLAGNPSHQRSREMHFDVSGALHRIEPVIFMDSGLLKTPGEFYMCRSEQSPRG